MAGCQVGRGPSMLATYNYISDTNKEKKTGKNNIKLSYYRKFQMQWLPQTNNTK